MRNIEGKQLTNISTDHTNIWVFNRTLAVRLLRNNLLNIWVGNSLRKRNNAILRGIGTQAVGWGIINVAIAIYALVTTRRRLDEAENPFAPAIIERETRNIHRALLFNTPLNLLYILGGRWLARSANWNENYKRGNGWGIVIQGLLLFIHDYYHLVNVPEPPTSPSKHQTH